MLVLLCGVLAQAKIDPTYSKMSNEQSYGEKTLCTAYKCEHSAP